MLCCDPAKTKETHDAYSDSPWVAGAGSALMRGFVLASLRALAAAPLARAAEIVITPPAPEETIHSNRGEVRVNAKTLGAAPGTHVRLRVDGAVVPNTADGPTITLYGIERGSHVLKAELLDADGAVIATSQPVTFYLWHASSHHPRRAR